MIKDLTYHLNHRLINYIKLSIWTENAHTVIKYILYMYVTLPFHACSDCKQWECFIYLGEGGWSPWSTGPCSRTCGGGTRTSTRNCTTPSLPECCPGNSTTTETCGESSCSSEHCMVLLTWLYDTVMHMGLSAFLVYGLVVASISCLFHHMLILLIILCLLYSIPFSWWWLVPMGGSVKLLSALWRRR